MIYYILDGFNIIECYKIKDNGKNEYFVPIKGHVSFKDFNYKVIVFDAYNVTSFVSKEAAKQYIINGVNKL